jgi:hypothetical protein
LDRRRAVAVAGRLAIAQEETIEIVIIEVRAAVIAIITLIPMMTTIASRTTSITPVVVLRRDVARESIATAHTSSAVRTMAAVDSTTMVGKFWPFM